MNDNTIKMFIGGEEVVSNKEFTINEEMLSASSTILNNCYPASWEESKDYVSNFYYPKDYSKYILGKGNFTYGTDQYYILTISGNNFIQFTTNVEKEFAGFTVYGNTTQETRSGKNLIHINSGTQTKNGVTITNNNDGTITVNGTCTAAVDIWFANGTNYLATNYAKSFASGDKLTLRKNIISGTSSGNWFIRVILYNSSTQQAYWNLLANDMTYTATFNGETRGIELLANTGDTFNNLILFPQLEFGANATTPEPYGVMPSPDYPSDLISVGYQNLFDLNGTKTNYNAISSVENNILTIISNGGYSQTNYSVFLKKGTYYINGKYTNTNTSLTSAYVQVRYNNTQILSMNTLNENGYFEGTFNINEDGNYQIRFSNNGLSTSINNTSTYSNIIISHNKAQYIPYNKYGIEIISQTTNYFNANNIKNTNINITDNGKKIIMPIVSSGNGYVSTSATLRDLAPNLKVGDTVYLYFNTNSLYNTYIYLNGSSYLWSIGTARTITQQDLNGIVAFYGNRASSGETFQVILTQFRIVKMQNTDWEEYKENTHIYLLNEPLRKVLTYKDKLYTDNNYLYVERKIKKVILNGTENWTKYSTTNHSFQLWVGTIILDGLCNYFKTFAGPSQINVVNGIYLSFTSSIIITNLDISTVEDFKTWLSTHNTEVIYAIQNSTIEELGAIELPVSYNGINNVEINTGIDTTNEINYYWKNYDVLFAGIVKNSGDISLRPTDPKYCSLQILDYKTFLSESDTLDFVISDKTIAEAISMVVDAISGYGFILGTINISQADDIIGAYSTLNKTAYDVFQYLANISGSRWRARFVDSDTMAIDFYDPELLPRANDIDYTQQYWEDNKIVDLTFNYGTRDYRNKQIILSDEVYGGIDYTEVLLSNGYGTSYITQNNIANITSITVNGVEAEVITQSEKDLGVDADFYYTPGKNVVESTTSYTAGTQIIITYTPLVKGRQIVYNDEEVTRIATQTNTTGVISRYENRNDILSSDELENIAETYIKYKGKPEIILKLTTLNNDLFSIGEICYFNSPIADLAQDYMVKSKATNYTSVAGETNIFYTYELTSSFNSEKAINYFDNQRNKATGNIAEGESITRNIDINNSAMIIWENATITEISVSVDGDNALNSVLNSPFIQ